MVNFKAVEHGQCNGLNGTPVISTVLGGPVFNHFSETGLLEPFERDTIKLTI